jgi:hypothetical protein
VLKARVKAENMPKWAQPSQESIWESGWEVRDGAGKRVMECEMCTENDKEGRGWERQWQQRLQRCRTWPGMYYKERTGAVAVRAALESAVQLGRGDEGNRQSEMANPTKCRDSLQSLTVHAHLALSLSKPCPCLQRRSINWPIMEDVT